MAVAAKLEEMWIAYADGFEEPFTPEQYNLAKWTWYNGVLAAFGAAGIVGPEDAQLSPTLRAVLVELYALIERDDNTQKQQQQQAKKG